MKIISYRLGQPPAIQELPNELSAMQDYVGGYIETVSLGGQLVLVCDEEGKLKGKVGDWFIDFGHGRHELLAGDFFVCRFDGEEDLTDIQHDDLEYVQHWIKPIKMKNPYKVIMDNYIKEKRQ